MLGLVIRFICHAVKCIIAVIVTVLDKDIFTKNNICIEILGLNEFYKPVFVLNSQQF